MWPRGRAAGAARGARALGRVERERRLGAGTRALTGTRRRALREALRARHRHLTVAGAEPPRPVAAHAPRLPPLRVLRALCPPHPPPRALQQNPVYASSAFHVFLFLVSICNILHSTFAGYWLFSKLQILFVFLYIGAPPAKKSKTSTREKDSLAKKRTTRTSKANAGEAAMPTAASAAQELKSEPTREEHVEAKHT